MFSPFSRPVVAVDAGPVPAIDSAAPLVVETATFATG
jgi:hypothetical protein